jgi:membrane protein YqaA with SNARE-associated domain
MFEFSPDAGLWGLAASAFLSATILPGNSEIVLIALLAKFPSLFWQAILVATLANTAGGMTSYLIGRLIPQRDEVTLKPAQQRALAWLRKHGKWALLLSWVPLVGDALCVAAGWLRINAWLALLTLALGKCARYLAVAGAFSWLSTAI